MEQLQQITLSYIKCYYLSETEEKIANVPSRDDVEPYWFSFLLSVKTNDRFIKQSLVQYFEKNGIGTRQLFAGNILKQPMMCENNIDLKIGNSDSLNSRELTEKEYSLVPNTDYIMNNSFWVGVFPALGSDEIIRTSNIIHEYIAEKA